MNESNELKPPDKIAEPLDFAASSEAELFEWMASAKDCADEAQAAFAEFYSRHAKYLFGQSLKRYRPIAEDVVSETFLRVYQRANTFKIGRLDEDKTPEQHLGIVRAWLGQIAHNVASDIFANRQKEPVTHSSTISLPDDWGNTREKSDEISNDERISQVRDIIESLPEREREIARIVAHSWNPHDKANRWSSEDLAAIVKQFGETPENIRQIKSRLLKKLRKLLTPVMEEAVLNR